MPELTFNRRWAGVLLLCVCLFFATVAAGAAGASTVGILPPANPSSNCDRAGTSTGNWGLASIDACRVREGLGPIALPSNWGSLTPTQQGFVLMDLERVNRGLPPIVGLSPALSRLAAAGAASHNDPAFPQGGFASGGGVWGGASSILAVEYMWMYDDGANGLDTNVSCPSAGAPGCWLHRDVILWKHAGGPLVAGGGYVGGADGGSYAYLVLAGYSTANLYFTWAHELHYFSKPPTVEPLTGQSAKASGKASGAVKHNSHKKTRKKHRRRRAVPASTGHNGITITFG